jgi:hypothetical protein
MLMIHASRILNIHAMSRKGKRMILIEKTHSIMSLDRDASSVGHTKNIMTIKGNVAKPVKATN